MKKAAQIAIIAAMLPMLGTMNGFGQQGGRSSRGGSGGGGGRSSGSSGQARGSQAGSQRGGAALQEPGTMTALLMAELQFLREEEKLARDVYLALGEAWGHPTFGSIARSEQMHMDAVLSLLNRYGISDPAAGNDIGQFTDPELQGLYSTLVNQGLSSVTAALRVGATIEDLDIKDLMDLSELELGSDIARVANNLLNGSKNHLRAFVTALSYYGETYTPQFIDQALYEEILNGENTRGNGMGQSNGRSSGMGQSGMGQQSSSQSSMQGSSRGSSSGSGKGGGGKRGGGQGGGGGKGRRS